MQFTEHNPFGPEPEPYRAAFLTKFVVFFNKTVKTNALGGGGVVRELSAAEAEKIHRKFEAKGVKIYGPFVEYDAAEIEAESAEAAAAAAVHLLGACECEGELKVCTVANLESKSGR